MVTVRAKDEDSQIKKDYIFHRQLLTFHSAFFAAALDPKTWAKNSEKVTETDRSHEEWDVFNFWVYSNRGYLVDTPAPHARIKDRYLSGELLYRMWVFGDFYVIPDLKNSAIDMLHESLLSRRTLPVDIEFVYSNTHSESYLRKFVLNWYTWRYRLGLRMENDAIKPTVDFIRDLYLRIENRNHGPYDWNQLTRINRCNWHDHCGPGGKLRYEARR